MTTEHTKAQPERGPVDSVEKVVVCLECAAGNESVGTEWIESGIFPATATIADVLAWKKRHSSAGGRCIITPTYTHNNSNDGR